MELALYFSPCFFLRHLCSGLPFSLTFEIIWSPQVPPNFLRSRNFNVYQGQTRITQFDVGSSKIQGFQFVPAHCNCSPSWLSRLGEKKLPPKKPQRLRWHKETQRSAWFLFLLLVFVGFCWFSCFVVGFCCFVLVLLVFLQIWFLLKFVRNRNRAWIWDLFFFLHRERFQNKRFLKKHVKTRTCPKDV